jgi:DNA-binding TFAR19-related protein (PDSD5 family)
MYNQQSDDLQKIQHIEDTVKQYLDKNALLRYGNIRTVNPQKAFQIASLLYSFIEAKQLREKLSDEEFKNLLRNINENKTFKITRR